MKPLRFLASLGTTWLLSLSPLSAAEEMEIWDDGAGAGNWEGTTFSNADPVDTGAAYTASEVEIVKDGKGRVYVFSLKKVAGGYDQLHLSRYDGSDMKIWDHGGAVWTDTFSNGDPVGNGSTYHTGLFPGSAALDGSDRLYYAIWQQTSTGSPYRVYLGRYDGTNVKIWDSGASDWTTTLSSGDPIVKEVSSDTNRPQIAVDSAGRAYVVWEAWDTSQTNVFLSRYDGTSVKIWDNDGSDWTTTFSSGDPVDLGAGTYNNKQIVIAAPDDKVYILFRNSGSYYYLSRYDGTDVKIWDNGSASWTDTFSNGDSAAGSWGQAEGALAADSASRVYIAVAGRDSTRNHIYLSRYDGTSIKHWDNGASSWTTTASSADPVDTGAALTALLPRLAVDSQDRVYVGFLQSDGTKDRLYLSRYDGTDAMIWDNDGSAWTDTFSSGDPVDTGNAQTVVDLQMRIDPQDRVYLAFSQSDGTYDRVYLTRYDGTDVKIWDHGANAWTDTFSSGDPVDTGNAQTAADPRLAIDAAGRVYFGFNQIDGTRAETYLTRYRPSEATTYDARVAVFKEKSTSRALGSMVGVWYFTGATFSSQTTSDWLRETPRPTGPTVPARSVAIVKSDPRYAFFLADGEAWRWGGTTWLMDTLSGQSNDDLYALGTVSSSFAIAAGEYGELHRWTGTSWLRERLATSDASYTRFVSLDLLSTIWAWASGEGNSTPELWCWRGTSWARQLAFSSGSYAASAAVATDYAWYWRAAGVQRVDIYRWLGTSWTLQSAVGGIGYTWKLYTIPGERDFALGLDWNTGGVPSIRRWTGTSWWTDWKGESLEDAAIVATDWAWTVGDAGAVLHWRGTSWFKQGPLTTNNLNSIDASSTDWAVAAGTNGAVWVWRGTSWRNESLSTLDIAFNNITYGRGVATVGEVLTFLAGDRRSVFRRQKPAHREDDSTYYRTLIQVIPQGGIWTWAGTSDTQSYIGLLDQGKSTYDFLDENTSAGTGPVYVAVAKAAGGSANQEDILVWIDTVGGWNGQSTPHNNNSSSGIGLVESGSVDETVSGPDVWGESNNRITCAVDDADTGIVSWHGVTVANVGGGAGTVPQGKTLTLEYWYYPWADGTGAERDMEAALHLAAGPFGTALAGLRWSTRTPRFEPRVGAWRWARDKVSAEAMKEPGGQIVEVAPTGEDLRLRVRIDEVRGGCSDSTISYTIYYSTDQTTWTQVTDTSSVWRAYDSAGNFGSISPRTLPNVDRLGAVYDAQIAGLQGGVGLGAGAWVGFESIEWDFTLRSVSAASDTVYYFRPRIEGIDALPLAGVKLPSLRTTAETTFNYLYSEASKGPFGRPVRNLQTISGGNGEAFKVAYVTTQGGTLDKVYAVSRTNGAIARSYTASGTLDYPLIYWDSTNTRYNLFFVQSGYRILALTDNGTTITANTAWASDGLKSFGNSTADPISEPIRIFDTDKQNYLYFFVTSYQNNTSTLYKVRASDGSIATGGNFSASAATIGVLEGLERVTPPLYVDGTVYAFGKPTGTPAYRNLWRIPASGGGHGTFQPNSAFTDFNGNLFPVWYSRDSVSSGPRVLAGAGIAAYRVGTSDMLGDSSWNTADENGESVNTAIQTSGPISPPFQIGNRVPVFVGDTASVHRISGTTGGVEGTFPYSLTGQISSGIAINGSWLYFGTDKGYIYAISSTDPTQGTGTRFRVPGDSPVVGVHVDATRSVVYYTTADGRVYQFDTR